MPPRESAGILLYRTSLLSQLEVLLVHMGGPFWAHRHEGAWTLPKGELADGEPPVVAARREFEEETGQPPPTGELIELGSVRQSSGKVVHGYAARGDFAVESLRSNSVSIEWPRGSGRTIEFPEVDRADWFDLATARQVMVKGQSELVERLAAVVT